MKHILGFSGGIDSEAVALLLLERHDPSDVILLNSQAGRNEDDITPAFVKNFSETVHLVTEVIPIISDIWETPGYAEERGFNGAAELTFVLLAEIKGRFPSRRMQFCTEILKLRPMRRWVRENLPDSDYEWYTGVRRDESKSRADTPLREWNEFVDTYLNHPIAEWPKQRCFDYVLDSGHLANPLYFMGFERVGCGPCVNSGKDDILGWLHRRPAMIDKVREYERQTGKTYFPPMVPGTKINFIDEVIFWAQTSHGGRQKNMLRVLNDRPACESKYGLCE